MKKLFIALILVAFSGATDLFGQPALPEAKPIPRLQLIPQPDQQYSFQRDRQEIARYHFNTNLNRPFVFPLIGPSGISLTRMGHPRDPESHSHHNSFWVAHNDVSGTAFWPDHGKKLGRLVHQRTEGLFDDAGELASIITHNAWINESNQVLLVERRQTAIQLLPDNEYFVVLHLELAAKGKPVTLGKTPFGMTAVRMAKSIGVHDGGGRIRNSNGGVNEKEVFWKPAKWCDYSGVIVSNVVEGITLMDHPSNPNHPTVFHVRDDGWMGSSLTFDAPRVIEPGKPLQLRYGLYVHRGMPAMGDLEKRWQEFTELTLFEPPRTK